MKILLAQWLKDIDYLEVVGLSLINYMYFFTIIISEVKLENQMFGVITNPLAKIKHKNSTGSMVERCY